MTNHTKLINHSEKKIKVAVIGAGYLGRFHAQKYACSPHAELTAIIDIDRKRANDIAQELFIEGLSEQKVPVGENIKDFIDQTEAVSIVVPTQAHYSVAKACLNYGLHCLIEKPLTTTAEQADHLINAAQAKKLKLQVGHLERFNPAFRQLKQELKGYNKPLFIEAHRLSGFQPRATDVNVIFDLMIHDIDLILNLVNSDVIHIEADGIGVITDNIDIANARIRFASGSFASLTSSRVSRESKRRIHLFADKRYYAVDCKKQYLESSRVIKEPVSEQRTIESQSFNIVQSDNLQAEIEHFLTAVKTNQEPLVTGAQGKKALMMATEITEKILQNGTKL